MRWSARRGLSLACACGIVLLAVTGLDAGTMQNAVASRRDPASAEFVFRQLLQQRQLSVTRMTPKAGVDAMLTFYASARFDVAHERGDLLRVRWGPSSQERGALTFAVVRRLTWLSDRSTQRDETWDLSLHFLFRDAARIAGAAQEVRECPGAEAGEACASVIRALPVYRAIAGRSDADVEIRFDRADDQRASGF